MKKVYIFLIALLANFVSFAQVWDKLPGPAGGNADAILSNDSVILTGIKDKGLYCSYDLGVSWSQKIPQCNIKSLLLDNNLIVAVAVDSLYYSTNNFHTFTARQLPNEAGATYVHNGCIYMSGYWCGNTQSSDTGLTWTSLPFGFGQMSISDSVWYVNGSAQNISRDNGLTWVSDTLVHYANFIKSDSNEVWLGHGKILYHSVDYGLSWVATYTAPFDIFNFLKAGSVLYMSGSQQNLSRSFDNGITWETFSDNFFPHYFNHFTSISGKILKTTELGIYSSTNGFVWSLSCDGIYHANIENMEIKGNYLFYNCYSGNIGYSNNGGASWKSCNMIDSSYAGFTSFEYSENKLFGVDCTKGVYMSQDTGQSWTRLPVEHSFFTGNLLYNNSTLLIPQWFFSETILQTTNFGGSLNSSYIGPFSGTGYVGMHLAASEKALIYSRMYVYRSLDNGLNWTNTGLQHNQFNKVCFTGTNFYAVSQGGVYRGDDSADVWTNVLSNIYEEYMNVSGHNNWVFVSQNQNIIRYSTDSGTNWITLDSFPYIITELAYDPPFLYVGTKDESIWKMNVEAMLASINDYALSPEIKIYPNPSSGKIVLKFPDNIGTYLINIYDPLGRNIYTQKSQQPIENLDLSDFGKGIYFIDVQTKNERFNQKIVLD